MGRCGSYLTVDRPWGHYTVLHSHRTYKIKEICIRPGKSISLQRHKYRSEHWNLIEGEIHILIDGKKIKLKGNEGIFVPKNTKHKISNYTSKIVRIIEVQIGIYLGEDDIERFEKY